LLDKDSGIDKGLLKTVIKFDETENDIILKIEKETESLDKLISKKNYKLISIIKSDNFDDSLFFQEINPKVSVRFIPAERVGISIFSTDISVNRIENNNGIEYQLPVKDALQDWIRIPKVIDGARKNIFYKIGEEIENDILGGGLFVGEGGGIQYKIDEYNNLSYFNTASNIKSLSSLIFYLKYYAYDDDGILFIDEPELNLHPDNQTKIAKILAKISNLGVKVIVSTHSDYIIREFNNLIMLSKNQKKAKIFMKEYNYSKDEVLKSENVSAYFFDNGKANELIVSETGFDVASIDETIELQNEISNKLYFSLFDN
jgi:broad-specificity NMP kinase